VTTLSASSWNSLLSNSSFKKSFFKYLNMVNKVDSTFGKDNSINIRGARQHNLKNIDLSLPRNKFIVFTGVSGSGKSSLAFDTIFAEGQRRYVESLSAYASQFLDKMKKPNVDLIEGLSPAISIEQKNTSKNPRSTVATVTEIYDYMRVLYARAGIPYSPFTGKPIESQTVSQIVDKIKQLPKKSTIYLYAPVVRGRKGEYKKEILSFKKRGFRKIKIDEIKYLPKNKIFFFLVERIAREKGNSKEKVKSIVKFEYIEKSKSKNIDSRKIDSFVELAAINLFKNNKNYEITLLFSNNGIITLTAEIVEAVLEDQNKIND